MNYDLSGKIVAILVTDGFEQSELEQPRKALHTAGAETDLISPKADMVRAWSGDGYGDKFDVDVLLAEADPSDYDALLLPGGVMNPDQLRLDLQAVQFVRSFFRSGKPVAAICHGPQLLIEAGVVKNRRLTSYPSLRTDLLNAGAKWVNEVVVSDHGLVTSRTPSDLPHFNDKLIEEIAAAQNAGQRASLAGAS